MQGRGSKPGPAPGLPEGIRSPLMQGRGSKHDTDAQALVGLTSPLMQGRGSKPSTAQPQTGPTRRPSCRGVDRNPWRVLPLRRRNPSPLMQGRGSKPCPGRPGAHARVAPHAGAWIETTRSEEHTSEPQSLMRITYAVFYLNK